MKMNKNCHRACEGFRPGGIGAKDPAKLSEAKGRPMIKKERRSPGAFGEALKSPEWTEYVIGDNGRSSELLYILRCIFGPAFLCDYTSPFPEVCLQMGA